VKKKSRGEKKKTVGPESVLLDRSPSSRAGAAGGRVGEVREKGKRGGSILWNNIQLCEEGVTPRQGREVEKREGKPGASYTCAFIR